MATQISSKEVDYDPLCPHCEKELDEIHWRRIKSWMINEYMFICPACKKILGIGSSQP